MIAPLGLEWGGTGEWARSPAGGIVDSIGDPVGSGGIAVATRSDYGISRLYRLVSDVGCYTGPNPQAIALRGASPMKATR